MTDENANTADLTDRDLLNRILARLDALEARADDRANTTRPLLDRIIQETVETRETLTERTGAIEKQLRAIDRRFAVFAEDIGRMRADIRDFDERLTESERRPN